MAQVQGVPCCEAVTAGSGNICGLEASLQVYVLCTASGFLSCMIRPAHIFAAVSEVRSQISVPFAVCLLGDAPQWLLVAISLYSAMDT